MSKKVYIAIVLLIVLVAASAAIILASQPTGPTITVGVHAGDVFTYSIQGTSSLSIGATDEPGFSLYNQTQAYVITITEVNNTSVSLDTSWRLNNGTEINNKQTIDLSNGLKTDDKGFWAIYAANLNVGDKLRPNGFDGLTVNKTDTTTYASGVRERNYMHQEGESFLATDPTKNTLRYDFIGAYFDKQTGMLESLSWITQYNNPIKTEAITWKLVSSTVWNVQ